MVVRGFVTLEHAGRRLPSRHTEPALYFGEGMGWAGRWPIETCPLPPARATVGIPLRREPS